VTDTLSVPPCKKARVVPPRNPPTAAAEPTRPSADDHEHDESTPAWASFAFTPKAWMQILKNNGVDDTAAQELFLLSQIDKAAAIKVIGKFLKKVADGESMRNPSAVVHTNVKHENESRGYWS